MFNKKSLKVNFLLALLLALSLFPYLNYAQQFNPEYLNYSDTDTTLEKHVQYKELYYRRGPEVMRVTVPDRGDTVNWAPPDVLFGGSHAYDDSGDQS